MVRVGPVRRCSSTARWRARRLRVWASLRVPASGVGDPPVLDGACVHLGGVVEDPDPVVGEVGVPGVVDVAVAEVVEGFDLPRLGLATVDGQLGHLPAEDADGGGESATGLDFGELVVVPDQDDLRPGRLGGGDEVVEVDGAAHPDLIDDHHAVRGEGLVAGVVVEAGDRERDDPGSGLELTSGPR
jgi:hypothetical protein